MIQYGVPTVAGLGTSVRASREDENIGPVALAGAAGAAGGYGGLLAARQLGPGGMLAGRIAPFLGTAMSKAGEKVAPTLINYGRNRRGSNKVPKKAFMGGQAERLGKALQDTTGTSGTEVFQEALADPNVARSFGIGAAAVTVPASALAAGLGGVAAGKAVGAFGIPGFVDPESYGSSNSPGARYKQTTVNYS